jgi:hypothetical protein
MSAVNVCLCQAKTDRTKHRKKFINAMLIGLDSTKFRNLVLRLCFLPEMEHVPFHFQNVVIATIKMSGNRLVSIAANDCTNLVLKNLRVSLI